MKINLIYAVSENGIIGDKGQLPWHLPKDLSKFKEITLGHVILMGRKTYESIGRPLPGRTNCILTSDPAYVAPGCVVVNSIDEVKKIASAHDEIFVIGGATLYEQFIDIADTIYLTKVHAEVPGDTQLPDYTNGDTAWQVVNEEYHAKDEKHDYDFTFYTFERERVDA